MTKRGMTRAAAGKAAQSRALGARKRKLIASEDTAPAGGNETLQLGEPHGSSVCMLTDSGVDEGSSLLSKELKVSKSCPGETEPLQLGCTTAQRERGTSSPFQEAGGSSVPDHVREPGNNSLVLSCTKPGISPVLESVTGEASTENQRGPQQQCGNCHLKAPTGDSSGEMGPRGKGAEIQEYPSTLPLDPATCPPGSPLPACNGMEVGRGPCAADGTADEGGEKEQPTEGTGDHPSDQPCLGEGRGTAPDPEPLGSAMGFQREDGPAKKKVRKRMGMWGFGERERRTHCAGQLGSGDRKNGESENGREGEGKLQGEHKEVAGKRLEVPTFNTVKNGTSVRNMEGMPDTAQGLVSQAEGLPSASDLSPPASLESLLEDGEPSQPGVEGSDRIPELQFTVEGTIAGETKSKHTGKTTGRSTRQGTSPCGQGEASEEDWSGGRSQEFCAKLVGAPCQVQWRCTGSPCVVQEEDCDVCVTAVEEVSSASQGQRREPLKVSACEPELSPSPDPQQSGTVAVFCDGVMCVPVEDICLLDPNSLVVSPTSDELKRMGASGGMGLASDGPLGPEEPVEPLGAECVGLGSSPGRISLFQGAPVTRDIREPPELKDQLHRETGDSMKMHLPEPAPVMVTEDPPAPGLTGAKASSEEHQHPYAHCVTMSVEAHLSQATHTEAQRTSGLSFLRASNVDCDQHQGRGDWVRQNMVSSHDVQKPGSGSGHPGSVCAPGLPPVCEDKPLPWDAELVHCFNTQPFTVQSPKASGGPDMDPGAPTSPSDSQLNNIALSEVEESSVLNITDQQEDASELVCGLIKELSSLNRTVMAAHRELDNIRRGNKAAKGPAQRSYGSRRSEI